MSLNCAYCSAGLASTSNQTVRCDRCGAVHHADGTVISPRMLPITTGLKMSPWMMAHTRPVDPGQYECRFAGLTQPLMLYWDMKHFTADQHKVRCATLLSWRGQWAM